MMLTKISRIDNFAVFGGFDWDGAVRDKGNNVARFKRLNIIYGRNYAGKTSLSRIVRSLELGRQHEKYLGASYEFDHVGVGRLAHDNLSDCPYSVRVYNKDFVDENLKWLSSSDGGIKPFAILGEKNIAIENEIEIKRSCIGSIQGESGLVWELFTKKREYQEKRLKIESMQRDLDDRLREKANGRIKTNANYQNVNYNISSIKADIAFIRSNSFGVLEEARKEELTILLSESPREGITFNGSLNNRVKEYVAAASDLLGREINPSFKVKELVGDHFLEEWVRHGMAHHEGKDNCQFCGGSLGDAVWKRLYNHFSKDVDELRGLIDQLIKIINVDLQKVREFSTPNQLSFYADLQKRYSEVKERFDLEKQRYIAVLEELVGLLESKKGEIYKASKVSLQNGTSCDISLVIREIRGLVEAHNSKAATIAGEQDVARRSLRLSEVALFIGDIDYEGRIKEIDGLSSSIAGLGREIESLGFRIEKIDGEIRGLLNQLKDERKGAEKVNNYLKNHFGHSALQLVANEDAESNAVTFSVVRDGLPAHNLSEGESSLLAFCYFIARLEDVATAGKDLIVWIDDPISSLDSNHVYFVYSLIENVLARPVKNPVDGSNFYRYKQLFVATHNLDFLKYLKRLSKPKNDSEFFIVERFGGASKLRLMPGYLRKYVTEFNYLFSQIYKCSLQNADFGDHEAFYNFGNNLRKFLEAYLFYKYPNDKSNDEKLLMFFGGDGLHADIANRINNELSHLEEIFDRSMSPVEIPEIPKLARLVLQTIEAKDPEQYEALIESIG